MLFFNPPALIHNTLYSSKKMSQALSLFAKTLGLLLFARGQLKDLSLWSRSFMSLLLDEKGPKNQGRHQGPTAQSRRPSPMSAVASAPNPVWYRRSHFVSYTDALCVIAGSTRDLLHLWTTPIVQ